MFFEKILKDYPFDSQFGPLPERRLVQLNRLRGNPHRKVELKKLIEDWVEWIKVEIGREAFERDSSTLSRFESLNKALHKNSNLDAAATFELFLQHFFTKADRTQIQNLLMSLVDHRERTTTYLRLGLETLQREVGEQLNLGPDHFQCAENLVVAKWNEWKEIKEKLDAEDRARARAKEEAARKLREAKALGPEGFFTYFLDKEFGISNMEDVVNISLKLKKSYEARCVDRLDPNLFKKSLLLRFDGTPGVTKQLRDEFWLLWIAKQNLDEFRRLRNLSRQESLDEIRRRLYGDDIN